MISSPGRLRRIFHAMLATCAAGVLAIAGFLAYAAFTLPLSPAASADLPSSAVVYATDAGEKFVNDFVAAWTKVMTADRFEL